MRYAQHSAPVVSLVAVFQNAAPPQFVSRRIAPDPGEVMQPSGLSRIGEDRSRMLPRRSRFRVGVVCLVQISRLIG